MYEKVLWFFRRIRQKCNYFEKKKMLLVTKEELIPNQETKEYYIRGKGILEKFAKDKNDWKVGGHFHYTSKCRSAAHSICNLKFNVPNEIPVVFHNGSNHAYHFIIKVLENEFDRLSWGKQRKVQKIFLSNKKGNWKN